MSASNFRRFAGAGEVDIRVCVSGHVHLIITAEGETHDCPLGKREAAAIADGLNGAVDFLDEQPTSKPEAAACH